jgi:hypothetical protein
MILTIGTMNHHLRKSTLKITRSLTPHTNSFETTMIYMNHRMRLSARELRKTTLLENGFWNGIVTSKNYCGSTDGLGWEAIVGCAIRKGQIIGVRIASAD